MAKWSGISSPIDLPPLKINFEEIEYGCFLSKAPPEFKH